jgi:hypothetical protein
MKPVVISDHALFEMKRRQIPEEALREVALAPEQVVSSEKGRMIYQSRVSDSDSARQMLLRVIVEDHGDALFVVTAYRTSKIEKYWKPEVER